MYKLYDILNELNKKPPLSPEEIEQATIDPKTGKKYTSREEFLRKNRRAWQAAKDQGILNDLFPMERKVYSREEIEQAAIDPKTGKKYKSSAEFQDENEPMYHAAWRKGILYDLFPYSAPVRDWTPEMVRQAAIDPKTGKIYTSRKEFERKYSKGYRAALEHNMMDELIPYKGELSQKFIYAFEFYDKNNNPVAAYIGLTSCLKTREKQHTKGIDCFDNEAETTVTKFIEANKDLKYEYKQLTFKPLEVSGKTSEERSNSPAGKAEREWEEKYKNEGWNVINKNPTGYQFGISYKKTREELLNQALKYKSWTDLRNNNYQVFRSIVARDKTYPGFKDQVKQAIENKYKKYNQKQQERKNQELLNQALKYKSWTDLRNNNQKLFDQIRYQNQKVPGLIDKIKQAFDERNKNQSIAETQYFKKPATIRNKDVPSTNYYRGLLKIANLTQSRVDAINNVLNNIDKNNKKATEKEYTLLQTLKTGNFKYSTKN